MQHVASYQYIPGIYWRTMFNATAVRILNKPVARLALKLQQDFEMLSKKPFLRDPT